jgi:hypothetical protein
MNSRRGSDLPARRVVVLTALFLTLIFGGQALADNAEPLAGGTSTADAVGRASFAYLSGFRTYGAAVLWNRLEPIMHTYYGGSSIRKMTYMVPTINAVVTLDPKLVDAYYVGCWIIASNGHVDEGIQLARDGAVANPTSGLLRTNYAQMLQLWGKDLSGAYEQAVIAMGPDMVWRDGFEEHDSYAVIGSIMRLYGDDERVSIVEREIARLDAELGDALPPGSHDHDGDGEPDH